MSQRIKNHLPLLELLSNCSKTQVKSIIQSASVDQVKALVELFYNIQYGTIPIPEENLTFLKNKKGVIRRITSKGTGLKNRKALLASNTVLVSTILKFSTQEIKKIIADGQ